MELTLAVNAHRLRVRNFVELRVLLYAVFVCLRHNGAQCIIDRLGVFHAILRRAIHEHKRAIAAAGIRMDGHVQICAPRVGFGNVFLIALSFRRFLYSEAAALQRFLGSLSDAIALRLLIRASCCISIRRLSRGGKIDSHFVIILFNLII